MFADFHLSPPGAYHHARFMGKSLYILKIYVLSHVFNRLTPREQQALHRLVRFIITLYGRYFLSASLSTAAPRHDAELWYNLHMYRHVDEVLAGKAISSVKRHLWYIVPELVVLALFDDEVLNDEKQVMATTLVSIPRPAHFTPGKPGHPAFRPVIDLLSEEKPSLGVFINERSWLIFHLAAPYLERTRPIPGQQTPLAPITADPLAWLTEDPAVWTDYEEYVRLQKWMMEIQVTNDAAERGVKNAQEVAEISRDPSHRDNVVLVMNDHRGRLARLRKADLNQING